ncbi:hypothetical protein [Kamptonema formosum]|uniref:hypothetical protein n=1 Tax=Kamptonema formosum TaxID=331992 RepID=UPI00034D3416|nr:hypothetical protein [Oscillatoria sp. PCC 10802]
MNNRWRQRFHKGIRTGLLLGTPEVRRKVLFAAIALAGMCLAVFAPGVKETGNFGVRIPAIESHLGAQPAFAQRVKVAEAAAQLYQVLPDLPRENSYALRETGKVDPENTLASRLIRYHIYVKGRPASYRLDWKLTLADYLDANELMDKALYPGREVLQENPMESDKAAISRLNRAQRDALVSALARLFNPSSARSNEPAPAPPPASQPSSAPRLPQPQPGDAQLLKHLKTR